MGVGRSTAGIPTRGKVDEDWEILENTYATAYDAINKFLLSRNPKKLIPRNIDLINKRFKVLYKLAEKHAPRLIPVIRQLHKLAVAHARGQINDRQYLAEIRRITMQAGLSTMLIDLVERHVDAAERRALLAMRRR